MFDSNARTVNDKMTNVWSKSYYGDHDGIIDFLDDENCDLNAVDDTNRTALHWACSGGHIRIVDFLISSGIDVNAVDNAGWTAVMIATNVENFSIVDYLINNKADINIRNENGYEPIHMAASKGNMDIFKLLIDNGANANSHSNIMKITPISRAVSCMKYDIVKYMIDLNVNVNISDKEGETPLHVACMNDDGKMIKLLLENKAEIKTNKSGKLPFELIKDDIRRFNIKSKLFKL